MLGSIVGALVGSSADSFLGLGSNLVQFNQQKQWQKEVMQNQMQWKAQDLKNAGLNPILAISSGSSPSIPSTSMPGVSNSSFSDNMSKISSSKMLNKQLKYADEKHAAEVDVLNSQELQNRANAAKALVEARSLIPSQVANYNTSSSKLNAEINHINEQIQNSKRVNFVESKKIAAEIGLTEEQYRNQRLQNDLLELDVMMKSLDVSYYERLKIFNALKETGPLGKVLAAVNGWVFDFLDSSKNFDNPEHRLDSLRNAIRSGKIFDYLKGKSDDSHKRWDERKESYPWLN